MAPMCDSLLAFPVIFSSPHGLCPCPLWDDILDLNLPVWRKGLFLQDSFFQYVYEAFENAVREILQRWGETEFLWEQWDDPKVRLTDALSRYRQLRTHSLGEEDQAVTVTSDDLSHKIVMDVYDFVSGEVKVKVAGERELVVEGRTETKDGDWSVSTNSFRRRFSLPANTDLNGLSAVLSDDGILTVTAPRMMGPEMIIPIRMSGENQLPGGWRLPASPDWPPSPPGVLLHPRVSELMGKKANLQNKALKNAPMNFGLPVVHNSSPLPIPKMGPFFSDPFFGDAWQAFEEAVREVLSKSGDLTSPDDWLAQYRTFRTRDRTEESQAVCWTEDEAGHKIVLDVQDFSSSGEVAVQFLSECELVVEGRVEEEGKCSRSCRRFQRCFLMPGPVDLQEVTSVISADGVLTITAPKKVQHTSPALPQATPVTPVAAPEKRPEPIPTHRPPPAPRRAATEPIPRVESPTPSEQSNDSCDSDGRFWTILPPSGNGSLTIEEIE